MQITEGKREMKVRYTDYKESLLESQRKSDFKVINRHFPNNHKNIRTYN